MAAAAREAAKSLMGMAATARRGPFGERVNGTVVPPRAAPVAAAVAPPSPVSVQLSPCVISSSQFEHMLSLLPPGRADALARARREERVVALSQADFVALLRAPPPASPGGADGADAAAGTGSKAGKLSPQSENETKRVKEGLALNSTVRGKVNEECGTSLSREQLWYLRAVALAMIDSKKTARLSRDAEIECLLLLLQRYHRGTSHVKSPVWENLVHTVVERLCKHISCPYKWTYIMDMRSRLNRSMIEDLHGCFVCLVDAYLESEGVGLSRSLRRHCILPAKNALSEAVKECDEKMSNVYPRKLHTAGEEQPGSLVVHLSQRNAVLQFLDDVGLRDAGHTPEHPILIGWTGDSGKGGSNGNVHFTVQGYRVFGCAGGREWDGSLKRDTQDPGEILPSALVALGESSNTVHDLIGTHDNLLSRMAQRGQTERLYCQKKQRYVYLRSVSCADSSLQQKRLAKRSVGRDGDCKWLPKGGACKGVRGGHPEGRFCLYCGTMNCNVDSYKSGEDRCDECQESGTEKCFHVPFDTAAALLAMRAHVELVESKFPGNELPSFVTGDAESGGDLPYLSAREADKGKDYHVLAPTSGAATTARNKLLQSYCTVLGLSTGGNKTSRMQSVEEALLDLYEVVEMKDHLAHATPDDTNAAFPLERVIICLLHMTKSCATRALMLPVWELYNIALRPDLKTKSMRASELERVRLVINEKLHCLRGNWRFKFENKCEIPNEFAFEIYRLKELFQNAWREIVDITVTNANRKAQVVLFFETWTHLFHLMDSVWTTKELTREISEVSHKYFTLGVALWGRDFITNYSHSLGCGHVTFLYEEGYNLKLMDQSSIESLIKLIKGIYQNKSSKGGSNQKPGAPLGEQVASDVSLEIWKVLFRQWGWKHGHLLPFLDPDYGSFLTAMQQDAASEASDDDDDDDEAWSPTGESERDLDPPGGDNDDPQEPLRDLLAPGSVYAGLLFDRANAEDDTPADVRMTRSRPQRRRNSEPTAQTSDQPPSKRDSRRRTG